MYTVVNCCCWFNVNREREREKKKEYEVQNTSHKKEHRTSRLTVSMCCEKEAAWYELHAKTDGEIQPNPVEFFPAHL
jgi:hypothetical protein